jgi:cysteine desulfurase
MLYFDNNSTTLMQDSTKQAMIYWCNRGNASSGYKSAHESRQMMSNFKKLVGELCQLDPCCDDTLDVTNNKRNDPRAYRIIFTSGASESNCTILRGIIDSYHEIKKTIPHVVVSAIEHISIIKLFKSLEGRGKIEVTYALPILSGHINPADIKSAIRHNTCLVCVMHANNEIGAINDIKEIGAISHKYNIPFHCDTVQTFGKNPIDPNKNNVDSFCISFHKLGGPPGVGMLLIKQQLLLGYNISPLIYGSQNSDMRGGTENIPGIGASFEATKINMTNRSKKNAMIYNIKKYICDELVLRVPSLNYEEYVNDKRLRKPLIEIVFISGLGKKYLDTTLFISIVKRKKPYICNKKIKDYLEKKGIIISVGSACNTSSPTASHVLYSLGCDELIRKGALRISFGDNSTMEEAKVFVREFIPIINNLSMQ